MKILFVLAVFYVGVLIGYQEGYKSYLLTFAIDMSEEIIIEDPDDVKIYNNIMPQIEDSIEIGNF